MDLHSKKGNWYFKCDTTGKETELQVSKPVTLNLRNGELTQFGKKVGLVKSSIGLRDAVLEGTSERFPRITGYITSALNIDVGDEIKLYSKGFKREKGKNESRAEEKTVFEDIVLVNKKRTLILAKEKDWYDAALAKKRETLKLAAEKRAETLRIKKIKAQQESESKKAC